ncbi:MAG TPA: MFS transporter [Xanthobacteraceae bacterium]|nr:MFS transporter [Xanthobacteraceae bacterium]
MRALLLLWLAGTGLRVTILAVPPILALIILDLNLSGTEVGILNGIPVALFALAAVPGSLLIARVGAVPALIIGLLITAAGSALRGFSYDTAVLYGATALMGAGVAFMQPALPPTVRQWAPDNIGFATAFYTNGLLVAEIMPVVFVGVVLAMLGGSWRANLVFWSLPVALVALAIFLFQPGGKSAPVVRPRRWMPDWRDPLLWKLGLVMAGSNEFYFCSNAFLPGFLLQTGRPEMITPSLAALNIGQLPASFLLLAVARRWERKRWPLVLSGAMALTSVPAILLVSSAWGVVAASAMIGFSCAIVLTLSLALPALLVAPDDVPRISAGMFTIGYGVAMLVSLASGMAWDITGKAAFAFLPIAIMVLPMTVLPLFTDYSKRRA